MIGKADIFTPGYFQSPIARVAYVQAGFILQNDYSAILSGIFLCCIIRSIGGAIEHQNDLNFAQSLANKCIQTPDKALSGVVHGDYDADFGNLYIHTEINCNLPF